MGLKFIDDQISGQSAICRSGSYQIICSGWFRQEGNRWYRTDLTRVAKLGRRSLRSSLLCSTSGIVTDDLKGPPPAEANAGQADPGVAASHEPALTIQTFAGSASDSAASGASSCFSVDTIRIEGGHELIGSEAVEDVTRPFALSCQSNESVGGLLKAVNGLFADRGFATTQAWLPEQDIAASRTLVLRVVPGRIDAVVYKEERQAYKGSTSVSDFVQQADAWLEGIDDDLERLTLLPPSARIATSGTIAKDDVLHVDRLQDTLDSLNRVPSNKAKAELVPGKRPATSDVQITNRINDAFRLYGGYDTESIEGVDKLRFGITAEKDNLIGINDMWGLTLKSGVETNELSGDFAVPVGRATMRLKGDWSENMIDLGPLSELFMTTWNSAGCRFHGRASRTEPLHQRRWADGPARFSASGRPDLQPLFRTRQRVGPDRRQPGAVYLQCARRCRRYRRLHTSQPVHKAGCISFGVLCLSRARLRFVQPSTQWAATALYSDDQMTIGSRSSVRGFSNGSFKADRGAVWRNEVAFAMPVDLLLGKAGSSTQPDSQGPVHVSAPSSEWARTTLSRLNPYLFLDAGLGRDVANEVTGYRVGSGVGLRYGGPRLSFDVGYAWRVAEDSRSRRVSEEKGELFMTLRLKVF
ncbi:hemolysin secretion/activation protein shlB/FhaC/HecB domain-containing protein [Ditylenchus destructor]|nr:hemolysin secretion/activation protein shlB/FhaC/HecB domain-containing protein [Ditylenchus destructor]